MLEDFIKNVEKTQRTIEIIEKEEWEYIKKWFYESLQDEDPNVIENLAKRLIRKTLQSNRIDKWHKATELVYKFAMSKANNRITNIISEEQFRRTMIYIEKGIDNVDIENLALSLFNGIEFEGCLFSSYELLALFLANLMSYSNLKQKINNIKEEEKCQDGKKQNKTDIPIVKIGSDLNFLIDNIIALHELNAIVIQDEELPTLIALDKLKSILDRFIDDETRNELDEKLNGYAQENLIALDKAEEIRKEYYDKKKALIKSKKKEGKFSEEEYQKELKDLEKEGKKSKKELYENRCKEMVDIIRDIVEILNAKGLTNLNLTQNYTTNFPRLLKERNVIYSKYKTGELPTHDNRHIIALGIEDLRQLYGKSLYLGTIQNRLYYINEHYDEYCWRKPNTWVKLHFYS